MVDVEVDLNGEKHNAPALYAKDENKGILINTPDGRAILMNWNNAIEL